MDDNFVTDIESPETNFTFSSKSCVQVGNLSGGKWDKMHDVSRRVYSGDGLAPTIHTCGGGNTEPKVAVAMRGRYNETGEVEQCIEVSDRECANAITTVQKDSMICEPVCLNSKSGRGGVDGLQPSLQDRVYDSEAISTAVTTSYMPNFTHDLMIRKLTPRECFRLMGFSQKNDDGSWDDTAFHKAEKVVSNSQLYKQAGNSIVVDVLEYLIKNVMEVVDMTKTDEKVTVYQGNDLINLAAFKEKEPELYAEILSDYPCEPGTYIFRNMAETNE